MIQRVEGASPEIEVITEMPDDLPILEIDSTRIAQVLDNFLANASKYAPGAKVYIKVDADDERVRVEVQDEGPGITQEHLSHLFERFYRVPINAATRGTGLGLYISRKIIDAHGGEIGVESIVGEGTSFFFTLPVNTINVEEQEGEYV